MKPPGLVDVSGKPIVARRAIAAGRLRLKPSTMRAIEANQVEKGDVEQASRIAALLAIKRTPDLLPHCHPVPIAAATVEFSREEGALRVQVVVEADYTTGVEMEALTGVSVALLTAWDMLKPLEKDADGQYPDTRIEEVRVVEKLKR